MPICPICGKSSPRRKNGTCPHCSAPVNIHNGKWYSISEEAPNIALLTYFEKKLSERLGETFRMPRKGSQFKREAKFAQGLLDETSGELEVAKRAIDILFSSEDFRWKLYSSLYYMVNDWLAAIFLARQQIEKEEQEEAAAKERKQKYKDWEDIWNSPGD